MPKTWRILSIDGGGIRGLIPATYLAAIEARTGKPICELFDLIAGTSTGGILALGLSKPDQFGRPEHSAMSLRNLYESDAPIIFRNPASWWENLLRPKYGSSGMKHVMQSNFGDTRLKQSIIDVLIPCYDIEHRSPHIFKSRWARRQPQYDFRMRDVAAAASATPTMFDPVRIPRPGAEGFVSLVDGGVFANNPAMHAFVEINTMLPDVDDQYLVVSLGTGESMERLKRKYLTDWGYVRWSVPMIELVSESISEAVHRQMHYLLPPTDYQRYYRFQVDLPDDTYYALDNPSKKNMEGLIKAAEESFEDAQTKKEFETLCLLLKRLSADEEKFEGSEKSEDSKSPTLPGDGYRVALCYAVEDLNKVIPLAQALKDRGIKPLLETFGLQKQGSIYRLISQAAEATTINIVIISPALLSNQWASKQLEWLYSRTLSGENVIMPVVQGFAKRDVPKLVHHLQWHEQPGKYLEYLINLSEGSMDAGIDELANRLAKDIILWIR